MSRKFIISEDERARILGLHETAKNNHGTVISEQSMGVGFMSGEPNGLKIKKGETTEQVAAGQTAQSQPAAQPQGSGVPNLSIFDKYIPSKEEVMDYVKGLNGLSSEEEIEKSLASPFYTKMYKLIAPFERNVDIANKTLPEQGENWKEWYFDKPIHISLESHPKLYSKFEEDYIYISKKMREVISNSSMVHTTNGPNYFLQIRTKDNKPYRPLEFNGKILSTKQHAIFFTSRFIREIVDFYRGTKGKTRHKLDLAKLLHSEA